MRPAVSVAGLEGAGGSFSFFDIESHSGSRAAHHVAALSDDDFRRLFDNGPALESDPFIAKNRLAFDILDAGDLATFAFDSMVDFDIESLPLGGVESPIHDLLDEIAHSPSSVQPSFGASTSRSDERRIAASG